MLLVYAMTAVFFYYSLYSYECCILFFVPACLNLSKVPDYLEKYYINKMCYYNVSFYNHQLHEVMYTNSVGLQPNV